MRDKETIGFPAAGKAYWQPGADGFGVDTVRENE
jgi:hypothetical protein